jgi:sugar phosphate permease
VQYQTRITAFYVIGVFSGAFSGLLAYAINFMDGAGGLSSWRWIFILEGLATVLLSFFVLFCLPSSPERSTWLTQAERDAILANRSAEGDDGHSHFEWRYLREVVGDYKVWMCTWLAGSVNIVVFGFSYTLPTILVQMGYKAANAQLLTVPVYVCACLCTLAAGIYSDRKQRRSHMIIVGFSVALVGLIMLYCLPKDRIPGVRYFACCVLMSGIYMGFPGCLAWNSNNAETRGKRNISMAFQLTLASLATAAGTNSYLGKEAPRYQTGFGFSMVSGSFATRRWPPC